MSENKQLTEKEKELIKGCIKGEEATKNEFIYIFRPKIFIIAKGITKDKAEAEDLTQDILIKLFIELEKHEINENLYAWVERVAKNYCKDEYRRKYSKKALKIVHPIIDDNKDTSLVEVYRDHNAIPPGSRKYYKQPGDDESLEIEFKRNIPHSIQKSLEISLEYLELLYKLKEKIKSDFDKYDPIFRVQEILDGTKKKITYVLGSISREKIYRYKYLKSKPKKGLELSEEDKKELNQLRKDSFKINVFSWINEFREDIASMTFFDPLFNDLMPAIKRPYNTHYFGFVLTDFAMNVTTMKIMPPRLMFDVWSKEKGLKKGRKATYDDLRKIELIFRYFKRRTKGTEKEFLFNSIDECLSTFDAIRKSQYKKPSNEKFYKQLVNFIYRNSFIYKKRGVL